MENFVTSLLYGYLGELFFIAEIYCCTENTKVLWIVSATKISLILKYYTYVLRFSSISDFAIRLISYPLTQVVVLNL